MSLGLDFGFFFANPWKTYQHVRSPKGKIEEDSFQMFITSISESCLEL
jgi:hypothetical protein